MAVFTGDWSQFGDGVRETSISTGAGNFTLAGAVGNFQAFSDVFSTGITNRFGYRIDHGSEWEVGYGYLSAATTLVRIRALSSSNSDAKVVFSAGTKQVHCAFPADILGRNLFVPSLANVRLSLSSTNATASASNQTTLYLHAYEGNCLEIYDDTSTVSRWARRQLTSTISITNSSLSANSVYDVFAYWTGSAIALEFGSAWSGVTTIPTRSSQDGIVTKVANLARRYVGSVYTNASGNFDDSETKRHVWNAQNRIPRKLKKIDTTASWTYASTTVRQARADADNQVSFLTGLADVEPVNVTVTVTNDTVTAYNVGIGIDSTTVNSADTSSRNQATTIAPSVASIKYVPQGGVRTLKWLEWCDTAANSNVYSGTGGIRSGMLGEVWA